MITQCPALTYSSKTRLGPSSQVLILRTFELMWLSQSYPHFFSNIPYGPTSDVIWLYGYVVSWVSQVLSLTGTSDQAGDIDCTIGLLSSTGLQQSMGTLGSLLGLLGSTCKLLSLWPLCIRLQMKFCCTFRCLLWEVHPAAVPLSAPFLKCLFCLTVVFARP